MQKRNRTDYIVVHCTATPPSMDIGAKEVDDMHKQRGWSGIGYHFVIRRNGVIEDGRNFEAVGSHVAGHNSNSIGISLVGGVARDKKTPQDNFTPSQMMALHHLIVGYCLKYHPKARVLGHRDFPGVAKACPSFDARKWAERLKIPTVYFDDQPRNKAERIKVVSVDYPPTFDNEHDSA